MQTFEVELRSLLTNEQYEALKKHFDSLSQGTPDDAETYTFLTPTHNIKVKNLLSQKKAKITVKEGAEYKQHANEVELTIPADQIQNAVAMITALGFPKHIPSVQRRINYTIGNIIVSLKHETHWGYHIEAERTVHIEKEIETAKKELTDFFASLSLVPMTEEETRALTNSALDKFNIERI